MALRFTANRERTRSDGFERIGQRIEANESAALSYGGRAMPTGIGNENTLRSVFHNYFYHHA